VRADAFVAGDLFRRESAGDEPQDLDLSIRQCEIGARVVEQDTSRQGPAQERTGCQPDDSAEIHG
jgi:hypothetical protein